MKYLNSFILKDKLQLNPETLTKNQNIIFWAVIILSIIIKFILIPYNMMDMGDSATRVWNAVWWAENPFFVEPKSSNPLWFYLLGPIIMITKEHFYTSIITMIVLMTIAGIYLFKTTLLIANFRTAMLAMIIFFLNPVIFRLNFEPYSQQPYLTAICIMVYYLMRAVSEDNCKKYFIIAGIFSFLALSARPEAIFVVPFFCFVVLLTKRNGKYYYILLSVLFPILWAIVSQTIYGSPFKTIEEADQYSESIYIQGVNLGLRAKGFFLPYYFFVLGMTFIIFWYWIKGFVFSYREHSKTIFAFLFIPIIVPAVINGLAAVKTTTFNTTHYIYLMFYYGSIFAAIGLDKMLSGFKSRFIGYAVTVVIIISCIPLSYIKEFVPEKYNKLFPKVIQFIVTTEHPTEAYALINLIDENINKYPSMIFDADNSETSILYLPFRSKLAPPQKVMISSYNIPTEKIGLTAEINKFMKSNTSGLIIVKKGGTLMSEIFSAGTGLEKPIKKFNETERWFVYAFE